MRYFASLLLLVALFAFVARSQDSSKASPALTNKDITTMVSVGLPADVIVAKIKSSSTDFDTTPAGLSDLKKAGVPDGVILAMVESSTNTAPKPTSDTKADGDIPSGKPRLFVTDSQSWLMAGGWGASNGTGGGAMAGGSSPQTVELIKTFGERCPEVIVSNDRGKASYVVLFDRESFKGLARKRDKIAIFRRNGDVLYSNSVRSVGNAVKDACDAVQKNSGDSQPKASTTAPHSL